MREQLDQAIGMALQGKKLEIAFRLDVRPEVAIPILLHLIQNEILEVLDEEGERTEDADDCCFSLGVVIDSGEWDCDRCWRTLKITLGKRFGLSSQDWELCVIWMTNNLEKITVID